MNKLLTHATIQHYFAYSTTPYRTFKINYGTNYYLNPDSYITFFNKSSNITIRIEYIDKEPDFFNTLLPTKNVCYINLNNYYYSSKQTRKEINKLAFNLTKTFPRWRKSDVEEFKRSRIYKVEKFREVMEQFSTFCKQILSLSLKTRQN